MPSKTFKRKNANSKNKNNNKNKKSIKRNSKRKYRTKKMRSNIRKMKGGGLKEVVLSYFKEKKIDIQNYSQNLNITDTKIDRIEFNNQEKIFNIWENNEDIKIPKLVPDLCTENLIAMEFIEGDSIKSFIENSTQEESNHIGFSLIKFIFNPHSSS